jgi:curved DNA-binding protein CbpA
LPDETLVDDYYATLGVPRDSSDAEVRAAYIRLVKLSHPDRLGTSPDPSAWKAANDRLAQFNEAFFVLGDPVRRKQYDNGHTHTSEVGAPPEEAQTAQERMFMIVTGGSMPERNVVIKALLDDKVITSYHSYITHCIFCTSRLTATDISNCIVKHFGMSNNPVFLVTEASGEIKGRLSMGAWEFIKKSTTASARGWK